MQRLRVALKVIMGLGTLWGAGKKALPKHFIQHNL